MPPSSRFVTIGFPLLLVGLGLLFCFQLSAYGFFNGLEARTLQTTAEMLANWHFTLLTYNGEPLTAHFPFVHYLQAVSIYQFQDLLTGGRLPSALAGLISVVVLYLTTLGMSRHPRFSFWVATLYGLSVGTLLYSRLATPDMVFHLLNLSITMMILGNIYNRERSFMRIVVAGFLLALAFLSAGPLAFFVPALIILTVVLTMPHPVFNLKCMAPVALLLACFIALLPWVQFFVEQNSIRAFKELFTPQALNGYLAPLFTFETDLSSLRYALMGMVVLMFPWVVVLPSALLGVLKDFPTRLRCDDGRMALPAIGVIWLLATFVLIAFLGGKSLSLIMLALPAVCFILADKFADIESAPVGFINFIFMAAIIAGSVWLMLQAERWPEVLTNLESYPQVADLLSLFGLSGFAGSEMWQALLARPLELGNLPLTIASLLGLSSLAGILLMAQGKQAGGLMWALGVWASLMVITLNVMPKVWDYTQAPGQYIGTQIKNQFNHRQDRLTFYNYSSSAVRLGADASYIATTSAAQLESLRPPRGRLFIVTPKRYTDGIANNTSLIYQTDCLYNLCLLKVE